MPWTTPAHSKSRVDRAGAALVADAPSSMPADLRIEIYQRGLAALDVVNNWRSSHSFPMNTFQTTLRRKARHVDSSALVAQRLKRLSSIEAKLLRFPTMKLSQMQDIGGCRAVVRDVRRVTSLRLAYRQSDLRHTEAREDNYIYAPKESGYRGIHLIYRYKSDKNATYNGLLIELQLRSQLQHAWATAVETVGTFLQQSLKASEGSDLWLRFFALAGGVFAKVERTPPVPGTPNELADLRVEAKALEKSLNVHRVLKAYGDALTVISAGAATKAAKYYLLELFPTKEEVRVTPFRAGELKRATEAYMLAETTLAGPLEQAVLVSAESVDSLKRAYPNYFLDTDVFLAAIRDALK